MRLIFKFGGSSLSSIEKIRKVANFIKEIKERKNTELIIVVSAMGKTTNKLDNLASSISQNKSSIMYSSLLSIGENISTFLLCLALENINIDTIGLTSKDIKIYSQGYNNNAIITHIDKTKIENYLNENKVVVISGFQGENPSGQTQTLGRGGSDTTAVALGTIFNAKVKIFTDVKGFYSLNPQKYSQPKFLKNINIISAINLSTINAKVLDYRCLCLLNKYKTKLSVLQSTKKTGTNITYNQIENYHIDGISTKNKITFVKNTSNKQQFIQNIINNADFKTLFYTKTKNELWAVDSKKDLIKTIFNLNNINIELKIVDILVISGSGLLIFNDFNKNVQKIISDNKIKVYYYNLTQTTLTIIANNLNTLENLLSKEFSLIKE